MRKILIMIAMMSLFVLAACGGQAQESSGSDKVFELNYNDLAPPTHPYTKKVAEPWAEFVEQETEGRVKIHVYPSSQLGTPDTGYDDVSGGVFDVGLLYASADNNDILFPLTIGDLPFALPTPDAAVNVMNKFYDKFLADGFQNAVWLGASATDTSQLYSTDPIESIEDIENRKVSNSLYSRNELIKMWGAVPVTLDNSALYESVERGIVDDVIYNTTGAIGFSLDEVALYMTKLDVGVSTNGLFINESIFNQMPEDLQTLFVEKLGPKHQELMADLYVEEMEKSIAEFENRVKDKGGKVIELEDSELNKFKEPAKKMWDEWVKEANKRGYPGDEMMEFFKESLAEEGVDIPFE